MTRTLLSRLLKTGRKLFHPIACHRLFSVTSICHTVIKSPFPDLEVKQQSLTEYLFPILDRNGNRTALVDGISGQSYTYGQMKELIIKIASALRKLGYKKGDVISIHATNSPEYAMLLLALPAAGITITTSNPAFTAGELSRSLELTEPKCIFTTSFFLPTVAEAVKSNRNITENVKDIILIDQASGYRTLKSLMDDDGKAFPEDLDTDCENDIVVLPFSSGTTGLPKAVMLNHRSIVTNLHQMRFMLDSTADDTFVSVLPFFHASGMIVITYYSFQGGNKMVTLPKFDPGLFLKTIQDHKVSFLHLVPPMAIFLAKHPMVEDYNLSSVRTAICGAAPMGDAVTEEFMDKINGSLIQGYGLTECGPVDMCDRGRPTIGTVGKLVPNSFCKIVDPETGKTVEKIGIPGELCFKGPHMMKGYLKNPKSTSDTIKDGWLHTGDIGYIREDGNFVISDRVKELIKYKGFQIAPAELENVLLKHPDVQDAAIIGVPDKRAGEVPRAYIVKKANCQVTDQHIFKFVKENVAEYKWLRGGVEFMDAIPKTPSGKILKRTLKEDFLKSL